MSKLMINFDLDGVLAQFTHGAARLHGKPDRDSAGVHWPTWNFHHEWGIADEHFYAGMGADFWAGLGRWEDGFALLERVAALVGHDRIAFITSPCQTAGCEEGKRRWAVEHLTGWNAWADVFIGGNKFKLAHPRAVLVEDSDTNVDKWRAAGGHAWLLPRPWNRNAVHCDADGLFDPDREFDAFADWLKGIQ